MGLFGKSKKEREKEYMNKLDVPSCLKENFELIIDDAFTIMGVGTVATGNILIGMCREGENACIYKANGDILESRITTVDVHTKERKAKVQTSRKKFEQKVRAYKNWIYDNRNRPMREIIKELNVKLIGHYRYYGVTWNFRKITTFLHRVQQFLFKAMNRRGCRRAYTWNGFVEMLKYYPLAKPKTYYCLY